MCGIYLTITDHEGDDTACTTPTPPDWLLRRGPDAWNTKKVVHHFDTTNISIGSTGNGSDMPPCLSSMHVTLYASVLQMRDNYIAQPVEIHHDRTNTTDDDDDDDIDTFPTTDMATLSSSSSSISISSHPPYLAWNGEIYEYYNIRQKCMESVYHTNVADTHLVSQLLADQVDDLTLNSSSSSTNKNINGNLIRQQQEQIARVLGQLTNAEYAFCIVTKHCIYYGRDIFGRRSLLTASMQSPPSQSSSNDTCRPNRILWELASVSTTSNLGNNILWREVEPGLVHVYPIHHHSDSSTTNIECMMLTPIPIQCIALSHSSELTDKNAVSFHRFDIESESQNDNGLHASKQEYYCQQLHDALLDAVRRRCGTTKATTHSNLNPHDDVTVSRNTLKPNCAILFSGGLDSTVIAALALEAGVAELTLLTVSFIDQHIVEATNATKTAAADAIAAEQSYHELCHIYPHAQIHFVHRIVDWEEVQSIEERIRTLAYPKTTSVMDVNIATALWFAASAVTDPYAEPQSHMDDPSNANISEHRPKPRILLSGLGADELMGGYGRHRNAYHRGGYSELQKELQMDMDRLWERNLGRDDRILSDTSKEVRFPFLDPNVIQFLQRTPLQYIVDYSLDGGEGDKRILRLMAQQMGLTTAASAVKRAIQFGSRISHVSDKRRYGSRRKANAHSKS